MISNVSARNTRRKMGRVTFGTLLLLTTLALMAALAGSNNSGFGISSAQAQLPKSAAVDESKAAPATGERIAFAGIRDGQGLPDIYTTDSDGNGAVQLTSDPGADYYPAWSPDGLQIAFQSNRSNVIGIYLMTADGGNQHMIGPPGASNPAWSPDGTKIVFSSQDNEIYVMNSDGTGTPTPLTTDHTLSFWPSWSPDGTRIAFANVMRDGDSDNEIYVMNSDGSNQHVIDNPPSGHGDAFPAWSPDSLRIAFTSGDSTGFSRVYTMDDTGSNISPVSTGSPNGESRPTWSPDGLRIAFQRLEPFATDPTLHPAGGITHIYVVDVTGGNEHSISGSSDHDYDPNWQQNAAKVVLVQNEEGTPVPSAQVWRNSQGYGYPGTFVGTTNMSGTLPLTNPANNEFLVARSLVYTGTTNKGGHDGWAYHVYATNLAEQDTGYQTAYLITDTTQLTQTLVITTASPLIGFNIVASVEYNATPDNLAVIARGLSGDEDPPGYYPGASHYLLDVTDGQMFFENVTVYEDKVHWDDADYQFFADYYRADANRTNRSQSYNALTSLDGHIHVQGSGHYGRPWNQTYGFSTLIHEFSHYAVGAADEYYYFQDGDNATCTLNPDSRYDFRASIMNDQTVSSEYCTLDHHNTATHQDIVEHGSVWNTFQLNWADPMNRWRILSPNDRGFYDPGPNHFASRAAEEAVPVIVPATVPACAPIKATVLNILGSPVQTATLSLQHNGNVIIDEGLSDINGQRLIYGAVANADKLSAVDPSGFPLFRSTTEDITSCGPITLTLGTLLAPGISRPDTSWPAHWLTATVDYSQTEVTASLHFVTDPPDQPALFASQGGTNRQQIALTYDPSQHNYTGAYPFDPARATDFQFEVGLTGTNGLDLFPYRFESTQFHSNELKDDTRGETPEETSPAATPASATWDIFAPESPVNLSVNANSLPDGTGVMAGQVLPPTLPPGGLLMVGGPISVQGQNPISGTVRLSVVTQSEIYCGLTPGSTTMYRYDGTGWTAMNVFVNEDWHFAAADITQWGIYAVFAQANPQTAFTDVLPGSTFFDYISWVACHGVASGYSDASFRPDNNATRGQISKMVANAFAWHLDPPSTGGYTFADVLPGATFYLYIEAAYREGVISGYPCGGPGEPCDAQNRPYFRSGNNVTRGQIAKIISNSARYTDPPTGQTFQDVAPGSTFYDYIERIASRSIINGYPCGGPGEPCGGGNLPYFRPNNNATRGQLSKMIFLDLVPR